MVAWPERGILHVSDGEAEDCSDDERFATLATISLTTNFLRVAVLQE